MDVNRSQLGLTYPTESVLARFPLSASRLACRSMRRGSGRRTSTHRRLDAQPADPHLRRFSMRTDLLHHEIRWNVKMTMTQQVVATFGHAHADCNAATCASMAAICGA